MSHLGQARRLERSGQLLQALNALETYSGTADQRLEAKTLKAALLERMGRHGASRALALSILDVRGTPGRFRAWCEYILGKIDREDGAVERAIERLQRASTLAENAKDYPCLCWSNMFLMLVVSQRDGFDAIAPLLARTKSVTNRLGDAQLTSALHLCVGQIEAKRGLMDSSDRHTALALGLLICEPNFVLEAMIHNTRLGVAILKSEFDRARDESAYAIETATKAASALWLKAALGNTGNLYFAIGDFDRAVTYFERALAAMPSEGENTNATLESIAKLRLIQERCDECADILERISASIQNGQDWSLYPHRYAALTLTQLFVHRRETDKALNQLNFVLDLGARSGDPVIFNAALLTSAEIDFAGRQQSILSGLREVSRTLPRMPPHMVADYEAAVACAALQEGNLECGARHERRAISIHQLLLNQAGALDVARRCRRVREDVPRSVAPASDDDASMAVQALAAAFVHANRPRVAAHSLLELLGALRSVQTAMIRERSETGEWATTAECVSHHAPVPPLVERRIELHADGAVQIEIVVRSSNDVETHATLNAIERLMQSINDVKCARAARDKNVALWPSDVDFGDGPAVIAGAMREQMTLAQRVARTNVTVLIEGESGTGKEILARAVHDFSDRASKPFVPLNSAAVPPHLVESTLFGHRRGAFTGADRDNPGLIRSARDGTLFLDEIGELALDLQPKLLRFLESGEISPLGDPATSIVNVRIVAATNRNLAELVQQGRFREDLFYRLNVVRLNIKPLRERRDEIPAFVNHFATHAAQEFGKGYIQVAEETLERLLLYRWPGNVRQLQNELRRMVALVEPGATLEPDMIAEEILAALPLLRPLKRPQEITVPLHDKLPAAVARIEREMIKSALREHQGRVDEVAKALGISRKGLYLKRQRFGL